MSYAIIRDTNCSRHEVGFDAAEITAPGACAIRIGPTSRSCKSGPGDAEHTSRGSQRMKE